LAEIPPAELIMPLAVIPLPGAPSLTAAGIRAWERTHGQVPAGGFVALHTGWTDHNSPGTPGWALDAVELLHARGVRAIGHDTLNTDPDEAVDAGEFPAQRWWLEHDHWQIENLCRLGDLPARGAWVMCTWPVPLGTAAFPARVIALTPRGQREG